MNARQFNYLQKTDAPKDPVNISEAMAAGTELVYFSRFRYVHRSRDFGVYCLPCTARRTGSPAEEGFVRTI